MKKPKMTALEQALSFLSYADRTKQNLVKKLKEKGFEEKEALEVSLELEKTGVINDARWVESRLVGMSEMRPCSLRQAKMKLKREGVSENLVEEKWLEMGLDEEKLALQAGERKKRVWGENREKLLRHLVSRGFDWEIIRKTLDKLGI